MEPQPPNPTGTYARSAEPESARSCAGLNFRRYGSDFPIQQLDTAHPRNPAPGAPS